MIIQISLNGIHIYHAIAQCVFFFDGNTDRVNYSFHAHSVMGFASRGSAGSLPSSIGSSGLWSSGWPLQARPGVVQDFSGTGLFHAL